MPIDLNRPKTASTSERVKVAGAGLHMKPAFARHADGRVTFSALLKAGPLAGQALQITAPVLTVETGVEWVARRLQGFADHPGARESVDDAVRRKVLAAQGEAYIRDLKKALDAHGRMELAMMLSAESHAQAMDPKDATAAMPVTVNVTGAIRGLDGVDVLYDNAGGLYRRPEEE